MRIDVPSLRAAWWAWGALHRARAGLRRSGLDGALAPLPPELPAEAIRGVSGVLRRIPSTCLEQALVLQAWYARHGPGRDIVIGVQGPSGAFKAHAWVDGDHEVAGFEEILRLPAR